MRKLNYIIAILLYLGVSFQSCKNANPVNDKGNDDQPATYKSAEEAAQKAKEDLLKILQTSKDVNLGIQPASLERAVPEKSIDYFTLDFSKLLQADTGILFKDLALDQKSVVVPLAAENEIVTVVELAEVNNEFRIGALGNKQLTNELNSLNNLQGDTSGSMIAIYEVPNLNKIIYGVLRNGTEIYYTNYGGKLSIERGQGKTAILQMITEDARKFQEQFGEQLKGKKLVK